ncbi:hypothetical protein [Tenacibaculum sp. 190524A05c]|uniref:hypothetical protein n=1 Tax=Tenacibaculum platacis TaxID=3137852 RepID=UPI0032B13012
MLILPVIFNYEIVDKLKFGTDPVFDYYLSEDDDDDSNFGLGLGFKGVYDISDEISITTMYSLGITNRSPDLHVSAGFQTSDVTFKFDFFQVGLSYKF